MIHEDLPQLLKLTTEEAASAEAASMAQLGTGASPFAVMKVVGGRLVWAGGEAILLFQSSHVDEHVVLLSGHYRFSREYGSVGFYFPAVVGARSPHFYLLLHPGAPVECILYTLLTWDSSSRLGVRIVCLHTFLAESRYRNQKRMYRCIFLII